MLSGCNSSKTEVVKPKEPEIVFTQIRPEIRHNDSDYYNGTIDIINDSSWIYTSHQSDRCFNVDSSLCRKTNSVYIEGVSVPNRIVKTEFELNVVEMNLEDSPYWVIVYQDWVKIDPLDGNGNHPITTLKLKVFDGKLALAHYDNSWQWGYDFGNNVDGDKIDVDHTLHQENTLNGYKFLDVGVSYRIKTVNYDNGKFEFYVNDVLVSSKEYQTKSPTENHITQWGLYWSKGYNLDNDQSNGIIVRIDDFYIAESNL